MDSQQYFVRGRRFSSDDPLLQDALAAIYNTPERPRCMCKPGGIEMYIANLQGYYVVKRLPDKGSQHHPACPSFEPDASMSGLGSLWKEAVIVRPTGDVELRFSFPMTRMGMRSGPGPASGTRQAPTEVGATKTRMGLLGFLHYFWDRAGFNRYVPNMAGKRGYGVIWKYGTLALANHTATGVELAQRVFMPEPYDPAAKDAIIARHRKEFARLHTSDDDSQFKMMIVVGEFKASEEKSFGQQIWLKHMPDCPLFVDGKTWQKAVKVYGSLLQVREIETQPALRLMMAGLVYAKREYVYQVDRLAMMLVTADNWIPIEGLHELDLIRVLVEKQRAFFKPLRFDTKSSAGFANVILLDTGDAITPLHVVGIEETERAAKEKALKTVSGEVWVWHTEKPMPELPPIARYKLPKGAAPVRPTEPPPTTTEVPVVASVTEAVKDGELFP